jgi:multidrug efflux pump subunit AcrB
MAFVSGLMGPYMSPIPINASMGMLISLAIAFIVTPWLALRLSRSQSAAQHGATPLDTRLAAIFPRLLAPFLHTTRGARNRRLLLAAIVGAIGLSVGLIALQWVGLKMLPFDNKSEFQVVVDMPAGTPVENTAAVLHEMGAYLATVPEVTDFEGYAGTAGAINFNGLLRQDYLRQVSRYTDGVGVDANSQREPPREGRSRSRHASSTSRTRSRTAPGRWPCAFFRRAPQRWASRKPTWWRRCAWRSAARTSPSCATGNRSTASR